MSKIRITIEADLDDNDQYDVITSISPGADFFQTIGVLELARDTLVKAGSTSNSSQN